VVADSPRDDGRLSAGCATVVTDPEVSIVIVTWNGRQHLDGCLTAVAAQRGVRAETILVDNASTDGTVAHVRDRFPDVRIVALRENCGFAGGNNAGVKQARAPLVAFLNNDTIAESEWLQALMSGLDESQRFALVTSRIVYMHDPQIIDSAGDGYLRWGGAFKRYHGRRASEAANTAEVFGACAAACLMPKAVFDEIGGFDEDFFASHEDVDLSYRARLRGYRVRYVPEALVRHHGSATLGRLSAQAVFYGQRNLEWAYVKSSPLPVLLRTLPGHVLYNAAAAVYFTRAGRGAAFVRAKVAAVAGLPRMLRKRAAIQRSRRVATAAIWPLLERGWIGLKIREKRFDLGVAGAGR
jgi:GT2 family glycosyltransferase